MSQKNFKPKSFWSRPEGTTGMIFGVGILAAIGYVIATNIAVITSFAFTTLQLGLILVALAGLLYMIIDPRMRNLIWYSYKSVMRWLTGLFVQIDPIGVLKSYIEDLKDNLRKMNSQIGSLRGQMHKLKEVITNNERQIQSNLSLANRAKSQDKKNIMILKSRKAGRLKESNMKLEDLYRKMEILYRVLTKMYENSEVLLEDVKDQVMVKEQERKAIRASHSAMKSAMNIISGNSDKREMFDMALEAIAEDVSEKVGEMERFMDMSTNFMDSVDLQNGIFEEEGLKMLEKWEQEGTSLLLGDEKQNLLEQANDDRLELDLNEPISKPVPAHKNQYDNFFDFD